ncbi:hypothetical protein MRB53_007447 [Persea americana]|uniref:Uncharacterized protein n=1 Tax=Persea americana TaxID=3435 RepID=A0ACC2MJ05_PERAE|nr:hypothetical protein MRB53_007447 [Persea americana]
MDQNRIKTKKTEDKSNPNTTTSAYDSINGLEIWCWCFGSSRSPNLAATIFHRSLLVGERRKRSKSSSKRKGFEKKEGLRGLVDFATEGRDFRAWGEEKATIAGTEPDLDLVHEQKFLLENMIRWERSQFLRRTIRCSRM